MYSPFLNSLMVLLVFWSTTQTAFPIEATDNRSSPIADETTNEQRNLPLQTPSPNIPNPVPTPAPATESPAIEQSPEATSLLEDFSYKCSPPQPELSSMGISPEITVGNNKIRVTGSTVFNQADFQAIVSAASQKLQISQSLSLKQLQDLIALVSEEITKLYLRENYITSQAIPPRPEVIQLGEVNEILISEGFLSEIRVKVDGTQRVNDDYVCSRIERGVGTPFNTSELEDQLKLLKIDPLFDSVEARLGATGQDQQSILTVEIDEADPFVVSFNADNYFPPSIGAERLGVSVGYRNLIGIGDEVSATYFRSISGGADVFDFTYLVPLNAKNGTLLFRAAPNRTRVTEAPFDDAGIRGTQDVYELIYRQPIVRSSTEEFALSLGFTYQNGLSFLEGQRFSFTEGIEDGVTRTSVINFSQDYLRRDNYGAWSLRSQFSFGTGLFNATTNDAPTPDGRFISWLGQVRRVQRLGNDHLLLFQADLQLTPDTLLPSQQFVIGGGQSVRGYRQNLLSGDNGLRFSVEDRIAIDRNENGDPTIQIIPFFDLGLVWNHPESPESFSDETTLIGAGLGLSFNEPFHLDGLSVRLDYGFPLTDVDNRGNMLQDNGLYFSIFYQPGGGN